MTDKGEHEVMREGTLFSQGNIGHHELKVIMSTCAGVPFRGSGRRRRRDAADVG